MQLDELYGHVMFLSQNELKNLYKFIVKEEHAIRAAPVTEDRFYTGLNEFSAAIYDQVHKYLKIFRFVNGDVEANKRNHLAQCVFWFYANLGSLHYLPPCNGDHHACTRERRDAALKLLNVFSAIVGINYKGE